ncbi:MAG: ATP-dependent DNA helicase RecG [Oscillospiraceae bacterium]|nr:ATP-dependent DNA helicase RecG [Oscillospiraceae bacterium]
MSIYDDISEISGVGPKNKELLNKCLIFTVLDLLLYFPRNYEYISRATNVSSKNVNDNVILSARVKAIKKDIVTKTKKILSTVTVESNGKTMDIKWFNQPYIKNSLKVNEEYLFSGKLTEYKGNISFTNPKIIKNVEEKDFADKIESIYPLSEGLTNNFIKKTLQGILENILIKENLPGYILSELNLYSLDKSIRNIHFPKSEEDIENCRKRLKFQEFFAFSVKIQLLKKFRQRNVKGIAFKMCKELQSLKDSLPFPLTNAQSRAVREILIDEKRETPTNRLIQGDVGSGKTIVALIAVFNIIKNGYQGAFMVPTEILAFQHYEEACKLYKNFNVKVELLLGYMTKKKKDEVKNRIKNGEVDLIIGTHSLFQEDVEFFNIGMVITDEQHRFGVNQRSKFINKGNNVDVLVMTATPIPRTMSLYLYGDLDISVIDELPPGRQLVETFFVKSSERNKVYEFTLSEINKGRQVYIVCPLIEDSEKIDLQSATKVFEDLKENYYKSIEVGMLYGRMSAFEKDETMKKFKEGKIKVLISTTVIEVGVNVPNATVMVVEDADRFGLAQLHQLRGRVGRGKYKSYCALIADVKNELVRKRMEIICSSNDGFYISEEDMKIRGSGEMFGFKQHGDNNFRLADINEDMELLRIANMEAIKLVKKEDEESKRFLKSIEDNIDNANEYICFN